MTAKIVTSWWYGKLPPDHLKIGISRGTPRGMAAGYRLFKILAPGVWFNSVPADEYRKRYFDETLGPLDPAKTVSDIEGMAQGRTAVLVCYESPLKPEEWCHRGYVSAWLHDKLGLEVPELGHEAQGFGWSHPKLPASHRQAGAPGAFDLTPFLGKALRDPQGRDWLVTEPDRADPSQIVIECGPLRKTVDQKVILARFAPA
ncbi:hypothetical protein ACJ4V0_15705 [Phreatobacter sp. HK31-P]